MYFPILGNVICSIADLRGVSITYIQVQFVRLSFEIFFKFQIFLIIFFLAYQSCIVGIIGLSLLSI